VSLHLDHSSCKVFIFSMPGVDADYFVIPPVFFYCSVNACALTAHGMVSKIYHSSLCVILRKRFAFSSPKPLILPHVATQRSNSVIVFVLKY
jgi:hypothetical protein